MTKSMMISLMNNKNVQTGNDLLQLIDSFLENETSENQPILNEIEF